MKSRIISGIIMALIVIPIFCLGGIYFEIGVSLLALGAYKEILDIRKDIPLPHSIKIIGFIMLMVLINTELLGISNIINLSFETILMTFIILAIPTMILHKKGYGYKNVAYLTFVIIFLSAIFSVMNKLYAESMFNLLYVVIVACATDIFALVGGKLIGKHKFTKISPNKTIEGCVVGSICSLIIGTTFHIIVIDSLSIMYVIPLTLILSVIGQIGDLFFSLIKRENDVKDFSNLIPGHGGILDRIDSIIFITIVYAYLIQFI